MLFSLDQESMLIDTHHQNLRVSEITVCKQSISCVQLPGEEKQVALLLISALKRELPSLTTWVSFAIKAVERNLIF